MRFIVTRLVQSTICNGENRSFLLVFCSKTFSLNAWMTLGHDTYVRTLPKGRNLFENFKHSLGSTIQTIPTPHYFEQRAMEPQRPKEVNGQR
jgi:hypothetical protein